MAKICLDQNGMIGFPTLILQDRDFKNIGKITDAYGLTYKENFNGANEVSSDIYKYSNGIKNPIWDALTEYKILYIPEFRERFEIRLSTSEENPTKKSMACTSLCESELSNIRLYNIEINTESDILSPDYDEDFPTLFYREPKNYPQKKESEVKRASLLHRILEKAPHYHIGHVDATLMDMKRAFSISDTDIYSELTGEIAEEFNCLFLFDSMSREISVYDLYNTCKECGHRGDFYGQCPECQSDNTSKQYGEDTTVFISNENLSTEITAETNKDSLKNCFYIEGGDDNMTSALRSINPNGTQYIFNLEESKKEMPQELVDVLDDYDKLYTEHTTSHPYQLSKQAVDNYNSVVGYINEKFPDNKIKYRKLPEYSIIGYPATTEAMYEATDLYGFVNDSMMPTIDTSGLGIEESLQAVIDGFREGFTGNQETFANEVALKNHTTAILSSVERAIENSARIFYSQAHYHLDLNRTSYIAPTASSSKGIWEGSFTLTSISERDGNGEKITKTSSLITLYISGNIELYIEQKLHKAMSDKDKVALYDITNPKLDGKTFRSQISLYSFNELLNISDSFQKCLDILQSEEINTDTASKEILDKFKSFYDTRQDIVDEEIAHMEQRLNHIKAIYFFDSKTGMASGELYELRGKVISALNFENYIKERENGEKLWETFCSYRMEDKYSNQNYISDGLTNSEVIENAKKLLDAASKELYRASHTQYTISSTMQNLLALEAFQPLKDSFSVGNWIRIRIDDKVFRLRLLSYQINFDDIQSIDVEFSTYEQIHSGITDLKSVLESASSIAKSYSGVMHQVDKSQGTAKHVQEWLDDGFKATMTKFAIDDNQDILIDSHGILGRSYDDITGQYNKYQFKLLSNGLYTTSDGWKTIDSGIGRIAYTDPETGKQVNEYGVIAKTIVGKLFVGEKLKIYGADNSIILDEHGITLDGGAIRWLHKIPTEHIDGLDDSLASFRENIKELQENQDDGMIETWFFDYVPTNDNIPAKNWTTDEEKKLHVEDLFYCTDPENISSYKYIYNATENKYEWILIDDNSITEALDKANEALGLSKEKRRIFVSTPYPPYDIGDLWVQGENGDIMRCSISRTTGIYTPSDWKKASKYTDDTNLNSFINGSFKDSINILKSQTDKKSETWYQPSDPSTAWNTLEIKNEHIGDIWFNSTPTVQKSYRWDGSNWIEMKTTPPPDVFNKIDGKAQIFVSEPMPPYNIGDLWVQGNDGNGDIMRCVTKRDLGLYIAADWVKASKYTDDTKALAALAKAEKAIADITSGIDLAKSYTDAQYRQLSSTLTSSYKSYTNSEVSKLDASVANYLGVGGGTLIGGNYIISPLIEGGYLNITNTTNSSKVIIDPNKLTQNEYIFQIHNGNEISVGVNTSGKAIFRGDIVAKAFEGNLFVGEKLKIIGANNSIILDENGILLDGGAIRWENQIKKEAIQGLEDLENDFVSALGEINDLKKQVDGKIDTWFFDYEPSDTKEPTVNWVTDADKKAHEGDLFYCTTPDNQHSYRYIYNNTSKKHEWLLITDTDVSKALEAASKAQDTADNKRRVFVAQPYPPYDIGDLWVQGENGDIMRCQSGKQSGTFTSSDWVKASKYTDDSALSSFINGDYRQSLDALKSQADKKAETWYQSSDPSTSWSTQPAKEEHKGDMWFNNAPSVQKYYIWNGSSWDEMKTTPPKEVFDKIDGKAQIFVSEPIPPYDIGDLWAQGDSGDLLVCIAAKTADQTYNLSDWTKATKYTDNTLAQEALKKAEQGISDAASGISLANKAEQRAEEAESNAKGYADSKDYTVISNAHNYTDTAATKLSDELKKAYEGYVDSEISKMDSAVAKYLGLNGGTLIGSNYVVSPYIAGGYLNISDDNGNRVIIDPNGLTKTGYIFQVQSSSTTTVGITQDGNAVFDGTINSKSGNIGGWQIGENGLYYGTDAINSTVSGAFFGVSGFRQCKDNIHYITMEDGVIEACSGGTITIGNDVIYHKARIDGDIFLTGESPSPKDLTHLFLSHNGLELYKSSDNNRILVKIDEDGIHTRGLSVNGYSYFIGDLEVIDTLFANNITLEGELLPNSYPQRIGSSSDIWEGIFVHGIYLRRDYLAESRINCAWKDGSIHDALLLDTTGLNMFLGWAGNSTYKTNLVLRGQSVRLGSTSGAIVSSDERLKNSFQPMDRYENFFHGLRPYFFKYNNGSSGRYHSGFKAQQVLSCLENNGLSSKDFAGFVKYEVPENSDGYNGFDEEYGLIYTEFVALNTHMIQKLYAENKKLKQRIENLERAVA